jgi:tetratricopeptide (TPR) repeat protein
MVLFLVVFFTSCTTSYHTVTIETAKPSQAILPENINSLTLMNRSISEEFRDFNRDSLQRYFYSRGFNVNTVVLDSIAADTTLKVLGDLLFESGRYDVVIPKDRNFARDLKFYRVPEELDWHEVSQICEEFQTDALLVMERYYNKLMTRFSRHPETMEYREYYSAAIDSKYDAVVKIYDPSRKEIVRQIIVADTISWFDSGLSPQVLFTKFPSVKECLIQTGIQVALDLDSKLSPAWVRDKRGYFIIEKDDVRRVSEWMNQNDWQSAYDYWLSYSDSRKKPVQAKAQFNLALASEMLGKIDEAIKWANQSYHSEYHSQTEQYLYKLGKRKVTIRQFQKMEEN